MNKFLFCLNTSSTMVALQIAGLPIHDELQNDMRLHQASWSPRPDVVSVSCSIYYANCYFD